jgi:hypothetical protein
MWPCGGKFKGVVNEAMLKRSMALFQPVIISGCHHMTVDSYVSGWRTGNGMRFKIRLL